MFWIQSEFVLLRVDVFDGEDMVGQRFKPTLAGALLAAFGGRAQRHVAGAARPDDHAVHLRLAAAAGVVTQVAVQGGAALGGNRREFGELVAVYESQPPVGHRVKPQGGRGVQRTLAKDFAVRLGKQFAQQLGGGVGLLAHRSKCRRRRAGPWATRVQTRPLLKLR
ncbi:hypothetical protein E5E91_04245 [Deinococcus radiodurans R1 = ATCC 13939 = DSM 20539]|uniref:Uncharacterized protein n=1 Tax=Deinococcus radiodurans (strain ATCC 13939 / DSM 20539 / JCM 16871 / CCUG 27074 / LMG 4051 / NBRC 15346 / NCIMB 9279 / VKM B-1422 / R1) TaxID=243230 RepID=Q9RW51_DEIRA|nr:hypothetical protein DR_0818 [Deinococcus radiodurans R1 = ATCC 13939 = DSM 20539]QEM70330.1 hypothetical protein DXG80_00155 [Deinococcus radiodurans]UDK99981.1 hypothetical protein E5E91_04245 [Deinococcus radiodurans R1 = ATCC 13939 = DSM 20539]HCE64502.1 hypothetical protein [Deinococcus radiodurans]